MFRAMRRIKQQITEAECIEILETEPRGVLSVIGDDGYPYAIPLNHYYDASTHKLYFHGAKQGHKIDAIKRCDKACFCVYDKGFQKDGEWALNIKSVVLFGRIHLLEDMQLSKEICTKLSFKFTDDTAYIQKELETAFNRVQCLEFTIEHMTGKLVNES
ncbi:MAG: pyridoxamine 5'-phosphate oxidase family protein [Proteobacteria bacterium]|nr:pyridoxamine 5'-phosphate oxidase family protein [Pseudomonadota bacterium]